MNKKKSMILWMICVVGVLGGFTATVTSINNKVNKQDDAIETVDSKIQGVKSDINDLQDANKKAQAQLDDLKKENAKQAKDIEKSLK